MFCSMQEKSAEARSVPYLKAQHAQHEVCDDVAALPFHSLSLEQGINLRVRLNAQLLLTLTQLLNVSCTGISGLAGKQCRKGAVTIVDTP